MTDTTPAPEDTPAGRPVPAKPGAARIREINDTIRYADVVGVRGRRADRRRGP